VRTLSLAALHFTLFLLQVYVVAKKMADRCTVEEYAIALAKHFVDTYPLVSKAKIYIEQKPWQRVNIGGEAHYHGTVECCHTEAGITC
jgi:urate oxidase